MLVEHHVLEMCEPALGELSLQEDEVSESDGEDLKNERLSKASAGGVIFEEPLSE